MAKITVKLFGVLRVDTKLASTEIDVNTIEEIFDELNKTINGSLKLSFKDALVYLNETRCTKKKTPLKDGDEVWLLSPASGG